MTQNAKQKGLGAIPRIPIALCFAVFGWVNQSRGGALYVYPTSDGTLLDGGGFGPFDGLADAWDWTFNESSYEGALARNVAPVSTPFERRLVFEFNLNAVTSPNPVTARLIFALRGAPVFPAPDAVVQVRSYPANLQENPSDFAASPTTLITSVTLAPFQDTTYFIRDVGRVVNDSLVRGDDRVAFRFQIDPGTTSPTVQAFMDALDSDPTTKPTLFIEDVVPGDADSDDDVDLYDFGFFVDCLSGPDAGITEDCRVFDYDLDNDVDMRDAQTFDYYASLGAP